MSHNAPPIGGFDESSRVLVDAFVSASRALVAVAARSLAGVGEEVTLPQYRTLIELAAKGPQPAREVAAALGVDPSTASRMIERLVRKGLARRTRTRTDRRIVRIAITPLGRELIAEVTDRRRADIERILSSMPSKDRGPVTAALRAFADAAGEVPEQDWSLGWGE